MRSPMAWSPSRRARLIRAPRISAAAPAGTAKPLRDRLAQRQPGNRVSRPLWEGGAKCRSRPQSLQIARHVRKLRQVDEPVGQMQRVADADVRGAESRAQKVISTGQARFQY